MAKEIERKLLVKENDEVYVQNGYFTPQHINQMFEEKKTERIRQGYLTIDDGITLAQNAGMNIDFTPSEVRLREKGNAYYLTVKSDGGLIRDELETKISKDFFEEHWPKTEGRRVDKNRLSEGTWHPYEIDRYNDRDLIVIEIEMKEAIHQQEFTRNLGPMGLDVTDDKKYKNKNLAK